jgi:NADH:ubiquinone oxidoreductase subunit 4 (subunit M)
VTGREMAVLLPLAAVTLYMGIWPATAMDMYTDAVEGLSTVLQAKR